MSSGDSWRVGLPSLELELQGAKLSASVVYILQFTMCSRVLRAYLRAVGDCC